MFEQDLMLTHHMGNAQKFGSSIFLDGNQFPWVSSRCQDISSYAISTACFFNHLQFMYASQTLVVQNNLEFGTIHVVSKVFGGPNKNQ